MELRKLKDLNKKNVAILTSSLIAVGSLVYFLIKRKKEKSKRRY